MGEIEDAARRRAYGIGERLERDGAVVEGEALEGRRQAGSGSSIGAVCAARITEGVRRRPLRVCDVQFVGSFPHAEYT